MRTKLLLLALLGLIAPVFGQDRGEISSIILSGPRTRAVPPQYANFERDLANQLFTLTPRVRTNRVVSQEVSLSLARLGRLDAALQVAPDKTTTTELTVMAARRSIVEGNEKIARGLIARVPSEERDGLKLLLAQSILMNRGGKQEALGILKTLPVAPISLSRYDISEYLLGFQIALTINEAGDKSSAKQRFDAIESRINDAEAQAKRDKKAVPEMVEAMAKSNRALLVYYRLIAGFEADALRTKGNDEFLQSVIATYFLEKNRGEEAGKILKDLSPDVAMGVITNLSYGVINKYRVQQQLDVREALFREMLPVVSADIREYSIRDMALCFFAAGKAQKCLPLIQELSDPKEKAATLHDFKRMAILRNQFNSALRGDLHKKWGSEELLQLQMEARKVKSEPNYNSYKLNNALKEVFTMANVLGDRASARNALYALEKVFPKGYSGVIDFVGYISFERGIACNWAQIGDWERANKWMSRAEKTAGVSNRLNLLLQLSDQSILPQAKQFLATITRKEWSKLSVQQVGQIANAFGTEASNKGNYQLPTWINNLSRADQKAFALARWTAAILPYESMVYAIPRNQ